MSYTVQPGDSMWSIAQQLGLTLDELLAANPQITNPDLIYPGQEINIPGGAPEHTLPHHPDPYPEIRVEEPNKFYASLLLEDYAGKVSELTAITQYVHHALEQEYMAGWQAVAHLEEQIAIVEMHHLEMLGKTLVLLGAAPRFHGRRGHYWSGRYVDYYDFDPCNQLRADIRGEELAIAQYQNHIQQISDHYIQALLQRIIKDEELHMQQLLAAMHQHCH